MIETGRFKEWAVIEMFGHRKVAGLVTEVELAGATLLRVEVPGEPDVKPQFVGGKSVYNLSLETEQRCRAYASRNPPEVLSRYELPATTERGLEPVDADEVDEGDDYDDEDIDDSEWDEDDGPDAPKPVACDLCDDMIIPGEELHTIKAAGGTEIDVCGKCARAEADTKPTRVPARKCPWCQSPIPDTANICGAKTCCDQAARGQGSP